MSSIRDFLSELASAPMLFSAVVFVAMFTTALSIGRRFILPTPVVPRQPPTAADLVRRPADPVLLNGRALETDAGFDQGQPMQPDSSTPDPLLDAKRVMRKIFRVLAAVIMAALLTLTFVSYRESTQGTGDVLFSLVLAAVTLITFLHLLTLDRRYNPEPDPVLKAELHEAVRADLVSKIEEALTGAVKVEWNIASPEVHRIDEQGLALARAMSDDGRSIDEICRAIESEYADWSPAHQQAFRQVMHSALDHS